MSLWSEARCKVAFDPSSKFLGSSFVNPKTYFEMNTNHNVDLFVWLQVKLRRLYDKRPNRNVDAVLFNILLGNGIVSLTCHGMREYIRYVKILKN